MSGNDEAGQAPADDQPASQEEEDSDDRSDLIEERTPGGTRVVTLRHPPGAHVFSLDEK